MNREVTPVPPSSISFGGLFTTTLGRTYLRVRSGRAWRVIIRLPFREEPDDRLRINYAADDCESVSLTVGEYRLIHRVLAESGHTELTGGVWA